MNILGLNLVDEPLDIDTFSYLDDKDYPFVVLGFQLKNLYDQKRLVFKKEISSEDIIHLVPNDAIMPKFFRGIKIKLKKEFIPFVKHLEMQGSTNKSTINTDTYKTILKQYNLTCDNCFAHLNKGIYPIDSECLNKLSVQQFDIDSLYTDYLEANSPIYQSLGYFVIYILSNKNYYETTTKNYLHAVVKKYNSV